MWKLLCHDPPYFISFVDQNTNYYIGVTNFLAYWSISITRSHFLDELKQSNEGIEFDDDNELLERGLNMIKNPDTLKSVHISEKDYGKSLHVSVTKLFEITLRLQLNLMKQTDQNQFDVMIQPLLQTICDLRSSQDELRQLLLKKDREIEEYKIEGKAPRRLITTVYNDAEHMMRHTAFEEYFSEPKVLDTLKVIAYSRNTERKAPLLANLASISKTSATATTTNYLNTIKNETICKTEPTSQTSNGTTENVNNPSETINSIIPTVKTESIKNIVPSVSDTKIPFESSCSYAPLVGIDSSGTHPKEEKTSQNSLVDNTSQILPTNVESTMQMSPKVELKPNDIRSPLKKRQRKQLNY